MQNNKHVVIFARAPRYGRIKTRLAKDIGKQAALRFYQRNLEKLIHKMRQGPWQLHVAVAAQQDITHPAFKQLSVIAQPQGNLGARMRHVLHHFRSSRCVIIGSDIPDISREHINTAFKILVDSDVVLGPSEDGGYWLIGSGSSFIAQGRFLRNVRWSSKDTLTDTLASIEPRYKVAQIAQLQDVDNGATHDIFAQAQRERQAKLRLKNLQLQQYKTEHLDERLHN